MSAQHIASFHYNDGNVLLRFPAERYPSRRSLFVLDITTHYALGFCPGEEYLCGLCTETVSNRLNWGVNGRAGLESDISASQCKCWMIQYMSREWKTSKPKDTIRLSHDAMVGCVVHNRLLRLCLDMTTVVKNLYGRWLDFRKGQERLKLHDVKIADADTPA